MSLHSERTPIVAPRGQEGKCVACSQPLHTHFDKTGRWSGCRAQVDPSLKFFLVPDRRQPFPPTHVVRKALASDRPLRAQPASVPQAGPVVYRAAYGLRDPKVKAIASARDREVFTVIARSKGLTRAALLKALRASTRTGIVDGAVRRLRLKRLITAERAPRAEAA